MIERMKKTIAITGGTGFVGKYLTKKILEMNRDSKVIIIDNLSNSHFTEFTKFLFNTQESVPVETKRNCEKNDFNENRLMFHKADIRDGAEIKSLLRAQGNERIDACVHLTTKISVAESIQRSSITNEVNIDGTANVVAAAREAGIRYFVFISSAAVYGIPLNLPVKEIHPPKPISTYGESKLKAEIIVAKYSREKSKVTILRLFNVYGEGQTLEYAGVISKFADRIQWDSPPEIYGSGMQTSDFVSVHDVINAIMTSAGLREERYYKDNSFKIRDFTPHLGSGERVYNIGTGIPTRITDLAAMMVEIFNKQHRTEVSKLKPIHVPPAQGDITDSYSDISRATADSGFVPTVGLKDGLEKMFSL